MACVVGQWEALGTAAGMNLWAWREEMTLTTPLQARQKKKRKGAACISLEKPFCRAFGKGVKGALPGGPHLSSSPSGTHTEHPCGKAKLGTGVQLLEALEWLSKG